MAANLEQEPEIPTRNFVDLFFKECFANSGMQYAYGAALLIAVGLFGGGMYEAATEGLKAYNLVEAQNFAEALRSGLAVIGAGAMVISGAKLIDSALYIEGQPNLQKFYDFHQRRDARWNARRG